MYGPLWHNMAERLREGDYSLWCSQILSENGIIIEKINDTRIKLIKLKIKSTL